MKQPGLLLISALIGWMLSLSGAQAQSAPVDPGDVLIYKRIPGGVGEFVRLTSSNRQVFTFPLDKCTAPSPQGVYTAQSSPQEEDLVIRRLDTQALVNQTPWQSEWEPCYLLWRDDATLSIRREGTAEEFFYFDVSGINLTPVTVPPWQPPQYPPLPDWMPSIRENYLLPSPRTNVYLYERCNGQQTTSSGETCAPQTDFVIYDASQQVDLHVLVAPDEVRIRGYEATDPLQVPESSRGAAWSASGRYLAFHILPDGMYDYFNLAVYDLDTGQYLDTEWVNAKIDALRGLRWSPQGNRLAFWVHGRFGEVQPSDNPETLRSLVFFSAETGDFTIPDQPYDVNPSATEPLITWAPDGQGLVFVDESDNLVYADASTGATSILDDHIERVVAWRADTLPR